MKVGGVPHRAIFTEGDGTEVRVIDQTVLPHRFETIRLETTGDAARAIRDMVVRGAAADRGDGGLWRCARDAGGSFG